MIGFIEGLIDELEATHVMMNVNGVGYEARISLMTFASIKSLKKCRLCTYLHVKEDAHTLYGFFTKEEKELFLLLISVSGIGPGTAMMMTSSLSVDEIKAAILNDDVKTVQSVKGIGAKTAQRVILELRDKIKKEDITGRILNTGPSVDAGVKAEAIAALVTLGIPKPSAEKSVDFVLKNHGKDITLENVIKLALKRT